jgi:Na+/melibiose symporter-like transporter
MSSSVLLGFAGGVVFLGAFAVWELRSDHPMLDVSFFRNPRFTVASLSITSAFFAMSGALFLLTQLLQFVKGYDALSAGLRIAPFAIVLMIVGPISPRIVERIGTKRTVAGGLVIGAIGLALLASNDAGSSYLHILAGLATIALGLGLTMAPATESIMGSLPRAKAGVGSAVNDTTRQTGGALGVAVLGSLFASGYRASLDRHLDAGLSGTQLAKARSSVGGALEVASSLRDGGTRLAHVATDAYVHGMRLSMLVGAVAILAGAALALRYLPARAADHPGHEINATEMLAIDVVIDDDQVSTAVEG